MVESLSNLTFELFKIAAAVALGIVGKIIYDRKFSNKPDLRYKFESPASFGTGEKERLYQDLVVSNEGTETAMDVRISFDRSKFSQVEYQIDFEGLHNTEESDDRSTIILNNLPPKDDARICFLFAPSIAADANDILQSVRADNCVGRIRTSPPTSGGDWWFLAFVVAAILMGFNFTAWYLASSKFSPESASITSKSSDDERQEIVRLAIQPQDVGHPGNHLIIQFFIENLTQDPFMGWVRAEAPRWGDWTQTYSERSFIRQLTIGGRKRQTIEWKIKVPANVLPGRYLLSGELSGESFGYYGKVNASTPIEVK
jgi:hypothetical protein